MLLAFSVLTLLVTHSSRKNILSGPSTPKFINIYIQEQNIVTLLLCEQLEIPFKQWRSHLKQLIPGSRRSPGGGHGNPLQYSCLENPMDRGAWRATVHRLTKSWTRLKQLNTHTCMVKARGEKMAPDSLVKIHLKGRTTPEVAESKFQR